jgi:hypothetical protein
MGSMVNLLWETVHCTHLSQDTKERICEFCGHLGCSGRRFLTVCNNLFHQLLSFMTCSLMWAYDNV